jgi:hypothetical protein
MTRLFDALATTSPSASHKVFIDPPSLLAFQHLPERFELDAIAVPEQIKTYLADVAFIDTTRAFDVENVGAEKDRMAKRFKADMLLLQAQSKAAAPESPFDSADSADESSATEDEVEAFTPPLGSSFHLDSKAAEGAMRSRKGQEVEQGEVAMEI